MQLHVPWFQVMKKPSGVATAASELSGGEGIFWSSNKLSLSNDGTNSLIIFHYNAKKLTSSLASFRELNILRLFACLKHTDSSLSTGLVGRGYTQNRTLRKIRPILHFSHEQIFFSNVDVFSNVFLRIETTDLFWGCEFNHKRVQGYFLIINLCFVHVFIYFLDVNSSRFRSAPTRPDERSPIIKS